jgi:1-acyl-sn-glycerol-3-phosphate acyltransferase
VPAATRQILLWLIAPFSWAMFALATAIHVTLSTSLQLLALPFDPERRTILAVNRWAWGYLAFAINPALHMRRVGVWGAGAGPYVVVCNHSSILDVPACMALPTPLRVVASRKIFEVPFLGHFLRLSRQISIDPGEPGSARECLTACRRSLEEGISVLIFPEGSRSDGESIGHFRRGAFRLSIEAGVPVLPVVMYGNPKVLPKGVLLPQSLLQPLRMIALAPIHPQPGQPPRQLSATVHSQMSASLSRLREQIL